MAARDDPGRSRFSIEVTMQRLNRDAVIAIVLLMAFPSIYPSLRHPVLVDFQHTRAGLWPVEAVDLAADDSRRADRAVRHLPIPVVAQGRGAERRVRRLRRRRGAAARPRGMDCPLAQSVLVFRPVLRLPGDPALPRQFDRRLGVRFHAHGRARRMATQASGPARRRGARHRRRHVEHFHLRPGRHFAARRNFLDSLKPRRFVS